MILFWIVEATNMRFSRVLGGFYKVKPSSNLGATFEFTS